MAQRHYGKGDNISGNKIINLNPKVFYVIIFLLFSSLTYWICSEYLDGKVESDVSILDVITSPPSYAHDSLSINPEIIVDTNKTPISYEDSTSSLTRPEHSNNASSNSVSRKSSMPKKKKKSEREELKLSVLSDNSILNAIIANNEYINPNDELNDMSEEYFDYRIIANYQSDDFPEFTFVLNNKGNIDAFIHEFKIELFNVKLNLIPVLKVRTRYCNDVEPYEVNSWIKNYGWGDANNLRIIDIENINTKLNPEIFKEKKLKSGESLDLFELPLEVFNSRNFSLALTFEDEAKAKFKYLKEIDIISHCCYCTGSRRPPDAIYVTLFDFDKIDKSSNTSKNYDILRDVPQKGNDVLSIKLGINKSSFAKAVFSFRIDDYWISSDSINVNVWNPRNSGLNRKYKDGQIILNK